MRVYHTHTRCALALTNVGLKEIHYIKTKITRKNNLVKTLEYLWNLSFKLKLSSITWEAEADLLSGSGGQSLFRDIVDPRHHRKEIKSENKAQTGAPPGESNLVTTVAQIDTAPP